MLDERQFVMRCPLFVNICKNICFCFCVIALTAIVNKTALTAISDIYVAFTLCRFFMCTSMTFM